MHCYSIAECRIYLDLLQNPFTRVMWVDRKAYLLSNVPGSLQGLIQGSKSQNFLPVMGHLPSTLCCDWLIFNTVTTSCLSSPAPTLLSACSSLACVTGHVTCSAVEENLKCKDVD